jgi:CBS domain-containing protein
MAPVDTRIGWSYREFAGMDTPVSMVLKRKGYRVLSVLPTVTVLDAVKEMNKFKVGCILVMEGAELIGVFTERDVLTRVIAEERQPASCLVRDVMTVKPHTITEDSTIGQTMDLFHNMRCRHLPVIEPASGRVKGMISIRDVSRWLADAHQAEAQQLREYITGYPA